MLHSWMDLFAERKNFSLTRYRRRKKEKKK
jgi:hypothetical protein